MPILVRCPCGKAYRVDEANRHKHIRCRHCQSLLRVANGTNEAPRNGIPRKRSWAVSMLPLLVPALVVAVFLNATAIGDWFNRRLSEPVDRLNPAGGDDWPTTREATGTPASGGVETADMTAESIEIDYRTFSLVLTVPSRFPDMDKKPNWWMDKSPPSSELMSKSNDGGELLLLETERMTVPIPATDRAMQERLDAEAADYFKSFSRGGFNMAEGPFRNGKWHTAFYRYENGCILSVSLSTSGDLLRIIYEYWHDETRIYPRPDMMAALRSMRIDEKPLTSNAAIHSTDADSHEEMTYVRIPLPREVIGGPDEFERTLASSFALHPAASTTFQFPGGAMRFRLPARFEIPRAKIAGKFENRIFTPRGSDPNSIQEFYKLQLVTDDFLDVEAMEKTEIRRTMNFFSRNIIEPASLSYALAPTASGPWRIGILEGNFISDKNMQITLLIALSKNQGVLLFYGYNRLSFRHEPDDAICGILTTRLGLNQKTNRSRP